jgi:hypothetical protein
VFKDKVPEIPGYRLHRNPPRKKELMTFDIAVNHSSLNNKSKGISSRPLAGEIGNYWLVIRESWF